MYEKNLVICDKEIRYAKALGEHISARDELDVKVYVCSSLDHVEALQKKNPIHIFIADEGYPHGERRKIDAEYTVVLGEVRPDDLGDQEVYVNKYQSADTLIRDIFAAYVERTNGNITKRGQTQKTRFIAVYSPIRRIGKTTFSKALAKEWGKQERVLYLNMEEYAGLEECTEEGWGLGDLLYFVKQGEGALHARMQLAVQKKGTLEYFQPLLMTTDLKAVSYEEWKTLFEAIAESGIYSKVILDLGESVQGLFRILEICERIYMPMLEDDSSQQKIKQYEENIHRLSLEQLRNKTVRFVMPKQVEDYAKIRAKENL